MMATNTTARVPIEAVISILNGSSPASADVVAKLTPALVLRAVATVSAGAPPAVRPPELATCPSFALTGVIAASDVDTQLLLALLRRACSTPTSDETDELGAKAASLARVLLQEPHDIISALVGAIATPSSSQTRSTFAISDDGGERRVDVLVRHVRTEQRLQALLLALELGQATVAHFDQLSQTCCPASGTGLLDAPSTEDLQALTAAFGGDSLAAEHLCSNIRRLAVLGLLKCLRLDQLAELPTPEELLRSSAEGDVWSQPLFDAPAAVGSGASSSGSDVSGHDHAGRAVRHLAEHARRFADKAVEWNRSAGSAGDSAEGGDSCVSTSVASGCPYAAVAVGISAALHLHRARAAVVAKVALHADDVPKALRQEHHVMTRCYHGPTSYGLWDELKDVLGYALVHHHGHGYGHGQGPGRDSGMGVESGSSSGMLMEAEVADAGAAEVYNTACVSLGPALAYLNTTCSGLSFRVPRASQLTSLSAGAATMGGLQWQYEASALLNESLSSTSSGSGRESAVQAYQSALDLASGHAAPVSTDLLHAAAQQRVACQGGSTESLTPAVSGSDTAGTARYEELPEVGLYIDILAGFSRAVLQARSNVLPAHHHTTKDGSEYRYLGSGSTVLALPYGLLTGHDDGSTVGPAAELLALVKTMHTVFRDQPQQAAAFWRRADSGAEPFMSVLRTSRLLYPANVQLLASAVAAVAVGQEATRAAAAYLASCTSVTTLPAADSSSAGAPSWILASATADDVLPRLADKQQKRAASYWAHELSTWEEGAGAGAAAGAGSSAPAGSSDMLVESGVSSFSGASSSPLALARLLSTSGVSAGEAAGVVQLVRGPYTPAACPGEELRPSDGTVGVLLGPEEARSTWHTGAHPIVWAHGHNALPVLYRRFTGLEAALAQPVRNVSSGAAIPLSLGLSALAGVANGEAPHWNGETRHQAATALQTLEGWLQDCEALGTLFSSAVTGIPNVPELIATALGSHRLAGPGDRSATSATVAVQLTRSALQLLRMLVQPLSSALANPGVLAAIQTAGTGDGGANGRAALSSTMTAVVQQAWKAAIACAQLVEALALRHGQLALPALLGLSSVGPSDASAPGLISCLQAVASLPDTWAGGSTPILMPLLSTTQHLLGTISQARTAVDVPLVLDRLGLSVGTDGCVGLDALEAALVPVARSITNGAGAVQAQHGASALGTSGLYASGLSSTSSIATGAASTATSAAASPEAVVSDLLRLLQADVGRRGSMQRLNTVITALLSHGPQGNTGTAAALSALAQTVCGRTPAVLAAQDSFVRGALSLATALTSHALAAAKGRAGTGGHYGAALALQRSAVQLLQACVRASQWSVQARPGGATSGAAHTLSSLACEAILSDSNTLRTIVGIATQLSETAATVTVEETGAAGLSTGGEEGKSDNPLALLGKLQSALGDRTSSLPTTAQLTRAVSRLDYDDGLLLSGTAREGLALLCTVLQAAAHARLQAAAGASPCPSWCSPANLASVILTALSPAPVATTIAVNGGPLSLGPVSHLIALAGSSDVSVGTAAIRVLTLLCRSLSAAMGDNAASTAGTAGSAPSLRAQPERQSILSLAPRAHVLALRHIITGNSKGGESTAALPGTEAAKAVLLAGLQLARVAFDGQTGLMLLLVETEGEALGGAGPSVTTLARLLVEDAVSRTKAPTISSSARLDAQLLRESLAFCLQILKTAQELGLCMGAAQQLHTQAFWSGVAAIISSGAPYLGTAACTAAVPDAASVASAAVVALSGRATAAAGADNTAKALSSPAVLDAALQASCRALALRLYSTAATAGTSLAGLSAKHLQPCADAVRQLLSPSFKAGVAPAAVDPTAADLDDLIAFIKQAGASDGSSASPAAGVSGATSVVGAAFAIHAASEAELATSVEGFARAQGLTLAPFTSAALGPVFGADTLAGTVDAMCPSSAVLHDAVPVPGLRANGTRPVQRQAPRLLSGVRAEDEAVRPALPSLLIGGSTGTTSSGSTAPGVAAVPVGIDTEALAMRLGLADVWATASARAGFVPSLANEVSSTEGLGAAAATTSQVSVWGWDIRAQQDGRARGLAVEAHTQLLALTSALNAARQLTAAQRGLVESLVRAAFATLSSPATVSSEGKSRTAATSGADDSDTTAEHLLMASCYGIVHQALLLKGAASGSAWSGSGTSGTAGADGAGPDWHQDAGAGTAASAALGPLDGLLQSAHCLLECLSRLLGSSVSVAAETRTGTLLLTAAAAALSSATVALPPALASSAGPQRMSALLAIRARLCKLCTLLLPLLGNASCKEEAHAAIVGLLPQLMVDRTGRVDITPGSDISVGTALAPLLAVHGAATFTSAQAATGAGALTDSSLLEWQAVAMTSGLALVRQAITSGALMGLSAQHLALDGGAGASGAGFGGAQTGFGLGSAYGPGVSKTSRAGASSTSSAVPAFGYSAIRTGTAANAVTGPQWTWLAELVLHIRGVVETTGHRAGKTIDAYYEAWLSTTQTKLAGARTAGAGTSTELSKTGPALPAQDMFMPAYVHAGLATAASIAAAGTDGAGSLLLLMLGVPQMVATLPCWTAAEQVQAARALCGLDSAVPSASSAAQLALTGAAQPSAFPKDAEALDAVTRARVLLARLAARRGTGMTGGVTESSGQGSLLPRLVETISSLQKASLWQDADTVALGHGYGPGPVLGYVLREPRGAAGEPGRPIPVRSPLHAAWCNALTLSKAVMEGSVQGHEAIKSWATASLVSSARQSAARTAAPYAVTLHGCLVTRQFSVGGLEEAGAAAGLLAALYDTTEVPLPAGSTQAVPSTVQPGQLSSAWSHWASALGLPTSCYEHPSALVRLAEQQWEEASQRAQWGIGGPAAVGTDANSAYTGPYGHFPLALPIIVAYGLRDATLFLGERLPVVAATAGASDTRYNGAASGIGISAATTVGGAPGQAGRGQASSIEQRAADTRRVNARSADSARDRVWSAYGWSFAPVSLAEHAWLDRISARSGEVSSETAAGAGAAGSAGQDAVLTVWAHQCEGQLLHLIAGCVGILTAAGGALQAVTNYTPPAALLARYASPSLQSPSAPGTGQATFRFASGLGLGGAGRPGGSPGAFTSPGGGGEGRGLSGHALAPSELYSHAAAGVASQLYDAATGQSSGYEENSLAPLCRPLGLSVRGQTGSGYAHRDGSGWVSRGVRAVQTISGVLTPAVPTSQSTIASTGEARDGGTSVLPGLAHVLWACGLAVNALAQGLACDDPKEVAYGPSLARIGCSSPADSALPLDPADLLAGFPSWPTVSELQTLALQVAALTAQVAAHVACKVPRTDRVAAYSCLLACVEHLGDAGVVAHIRAIEDNEEEEDERSLVSPGGGLGGFYPSGPGAGAGPGAQAGGVRTARRYSATSMYSAPGRGSMSIAGHTHGGHTVRSSLSNRTVALLHVGQDREAADRTTRMLLQVTGLAAPGAELERARLLHALVASLCFLHARMVEDRLPAFATRPSGVRHYRGMLLQALAVQSPGTIDQQQQQDGSRQVLTLGEMLLEGSPTGQGLSGSGGDGGGKGQGTGAGAGPDVGMSEDRPQGLARLDDSQGPLAISALEPMATGTVGTGAATAADGSRAMAQHAFSPVLPVVSPKAPTAGGAGALGFGFNLGAAAPAPSAPAAPAPASTAAAAAAMVGAGTGLPPTGLSTAAAPATTTGLGLGLGLGFGSPNPIMAGTQLVPGQTLAGLGGATPGLPASLASSAAPIGVGPSGVPYTFRFDRYQSTGQTPA